MKRETNYIQNPFKQRAEGGYIVTVPTLPGCLTFGATMDEAITNAKEAVELYLESLTVHGVPCFTG